MPDDAGGCVPILPAEACPPGQMAELGETACHDVAPCGSAPWGDAPLDGTTQLVDAAYSGADSDGTEARPWTTIQEAIDHAAPGALVAIAEGRYAEHIVIEGRPVRLWGRCPSLVEITGPGATNFLVRVGRRADDTEIRGIAIRGRGIGMMVSGSTRVVVDQSWIHGTGDVGVLSTDYVGPADVTLRRTLIERATGAGVIVFGGAATLEDAAIRGTAIASGPPVLGYGMGIDVVSSAGERGRITARRVVLERLRGLGVRLTSADGVFEETVVRDVDWLSDDKPGLGLGATHSSESAPSTLSVRASVLERTHAAGIAAAGVEASVETTVVRDVSPGSAPDSPAGAVGIFVEPSVTDGHPAKVTLRHLLIERSKERGMIVYGSEVEAVGVLVRETLPGGPNLGAGLDIAPKIQRANVTIRGSVVEGSYGVGVSLLGSDLLLEGTVVRGTAPLPSSLELGRGVNIQAMPDLGERARARARATLRNVLIERNLDFGLAVFNSDVDVASTTIRDTAGRAVDGAYGCGVLAFRDGGQANMVLRGNTIERSATAGIYNIAGNLKLESTSFLCEPVDLTKDDDGGLAAVYEDLGENVCGCNGSTIACEIKSSDLTPPEPLPPVLANGVGGI